MPQAIPTSEERGRGAHEPIDQEQLIRNVEATSRVLKVAFNEEITRKCVHVFAPEFATAPVQFKTTSKEPGKNALYYRFEAPWWLDLLAVAIENGLLPETAAALPGHQLLTKARELYPASWCMADFAAARGLEKVWLFLGSDRCLKRLLPALPESVRQLLPLLREFGLLKTSIIGTDFHNNSVNIYFDPPTRSDGDSGFNEGYVKRLLARVGFQAPTLSDEIAKDIVAKCSVIAFTFRYEVPDKVERLCFYNFMLDGNQLPSDVPEQLRLFARDGKSIVEKPGVFLGRSFGIDPAGDYYKLDLDYTGEAPRVAVSFHPHLSS